MNIPKITALVPMKGHSERVPHKNVRPLAGKPACHWILQTLSDCAHVSDIVVDTDDDEIFALASVFPKVKAVKRPDFLLGDHVSIGPLIGYDITHSENEFFLQTHSTNPCVTVETLNRAMETFFSQKEHDALFSVTEIKTRFYWPDGRGINHDPAFLIRTQDLAPIYEENSCFYIFSRSMFDRVKNRLGIKPMMFPISRYEAADIDYIEDFCWAEFILQHNLNITGRNRK
jgi:CMP-N-acetylneuraminic acid synthetase